MFSFETKPSPVTWLLHKTYPGHDHLGADFMSEWNDFDFEIPKYICNELIDTYLLGR